MCLRISLFLILAISIFGNSSNVICQPGEAVAASAVDARLYLAGLESPDEARQFLAILKQNLEGSEHLAIVKMVRLPLKIHSGSKHTYRDPDSLVRDFDKVFTQQVRDAIIKASYENLFINSQGVMLGDGAVWFDKQAGTVQIKAINP